MVLHLSAIALLVAAFVIATITPLNLGALGLVATFLVGAVWVQLSSADLFAGFPASVLVVLVGVTYLFNVARANGTIDWMLGGAVKLVRGRTWIIPWVMFAASGLFSGIGALFSVPIVAPIALAFAARNRISQFYMGLMVIHGTCAGCLAPISVYGVIVNGILQANGFAPNPMKIFLIALAANIVIGVVVTLLFGRRRVATHELVPAEMAAVGSGRGPHSGTGGAAGPENTPAGSGGHGGEPDDGTPAVRAGRDIWLTTIAIALLVVLGVALRLDIGLFAITLCVALGLVNGKNHKEAIATIPWSVVLLVCGVLTYVGVLQKIGTVAWLGEAVAAIGMPLVAALALAYVGGIVSAFATSSGVIAALVPLAVPLLQAGDLNPVSLVAVIAIASTVVDTSPFSSHGAIVVANTTLDERERVLKNLLRYSFAIVALAPTVLWAAVVVPGF